MNGAESLIRSLVSAGVDVCFANPGTSEMHLVQAIDAVPEMRGVLSTFEGVCTGAADGYGRMLGKPATTLLHLGPGLGNGVANLHNARRAATPIINLVGNHALYHVAFDAPLTSDIDTLANNFSSWIKSDSTATSLAADGMSALTAAMTAKPGSEGQISTMIIPADACWEDASEVAPVPALPDRAAVSAAAVEAVAKAIDSETLILLDGEGLTITARIAAAKVAAAAQCRVAMATFPARVDGGAGLPLMERLPYFPEHVLAALKGVKRIVLCGAEAPVSFFAYPGIPSSLVPEDCEVIRLAAGHEDTGQALDDLVQALGAEQQRYPVTDAIVTEGLTPELPEGRLSTGNIAAIVARVIPEGTILCGDSGGGGAAFGPTQGSAANTWLNLTGGSIGQGGPAAVGAAIACPDRPVLALLGDGASMYTNQAFWTQAREGLNVTTVIFNNSKYGILETEYLRLGVNEIGERAGDLFDLSKPDIDFVQLAGSMGVPGSRTSDATEFARLLTTALSEPGPYLIEAQL